MQSFHKENTRRKQEDFTNLITERPEGMEFEEYRQIRKEQNAKLKWYLSTNTIKAQPSYNRMQQQIKKPRKQFILIKAKDKDGKIIPFQFEKKPKRILHYD